MARPGDRSVYARFENRTETGRHAEFNTPIVTWATDRDAWVQLEPKRGRERREAGVVDGTVSHTVRGDYYDLDGVTTAMRMVVDPEGTFDDETRKAYFDIEAIQTDHTNHGETMLQVREVSSAEAAAN